MRLEHFRHSVLAQWQALTLPGALYRFWVPLVLLIALVYQLQTHGIAFWDAQEGVESPVIWSLSLEGVAFFLWATRKRRFMVPAFITTVVLLAGPLYTVGLPLYTAVIEDSSDGKLVTERVREIEAQIAEEKRLLAHYKQQSDTKHGWGKLMVATSDTIKALQEQKFRLRAEAPHEEMSVFALLVGVLQLVSLILFQWFSVVAIRTISCYWSESREAVKLAHGSNNYSRDTTNGPRPVDSDQIRTTELSHGSDSQANGSGHSPANGSTFAGSGSTDDLPEIHFGSSGSVKRGALDPRVRTDGMDAIAEASATVTAGLSGSEFTPELITRTQEALQAFLDANSMSVRAFAEKFAYNRRDLNYFRDHERRIADGERPASKNCIRRLVEQFKTADEDFVSEPQKARLIPFLKVRTV